MIDTRTLSRAVIAAVLYYTAVVTLLHVLEPGIDPIAVPMSAYVNTDSGALMSTTYWAFALALIGIAVGLRRTLSMTALSGIGVALFSIAALAGMTAGIFPGEPPPPQTLSGKIHFGSAIVAFPAIGVAIVLCSLAIRKDARWQAVAGRIGWLAVGTAMTTVLFPVLAPGNFGGLAQRADFLFMFTWFVVVAHRLPRLGGVIHGSLVAERVLR